MSTYKSYFWSLGTTSFRTKEFNRTIERQLGLLSEFWKKREIAGKTWNATIQAKYYDFIKDKGFVFGSAKNKSKDAREKTSGLKDIGLINEERQLSEVGITLLDIAEHQAFYSNNPLRIANDSYIYFKQLCKSSVPIDDGFVRPYLVATYVLSEIGKLYNDEFTFLLPLITNEEKLHRIIAELRAVREKIRTVDDIIIDILMGMPNYQEALDNFLSNFVTKELIIKIGFNRKSGSYDVSYFDFYRALKKITFERTDKNAKKLIQSIEFIKPNPRKFWKKLLLKKSKISKSEKEKLAAIDFSAEIFAVKSEEEFKRKFFKFLHLYKAKSTLSDYFDLNRRYFKITDTFVFRDGTVDLDVISKCYFKLITDKLLPVAFTKTDKLYTNCELAEIIPGSSVSESSLFAQIERFHGVTVKNLDDVKQFVEDERIIRFNDMIDTKFPKEVLIDLLEKFETRKEDETIQNLVTSNADIPTIFEYIIGIIWYNISERKVNILKALNLSLDADLLPKTHAKGGGEDMTFKYDATDQYPEHMLLLEVTLTEKSNQRRAEMEPVSRHLGEHLLKYKEAEAYCIFVATFLHINLISHFRTQKEAYYYNPSNNSDFIKGMKIIPCQTEELRTIMGKDIKYSYIYRLFEAAYHSKNMPNEWYQQEIVDKVT